MQIWHGPAWFLLFYTPRRLRRLARAWRRLRSPAWVLWRRAWAGKLIVSRA